MAFRTSFNYQLTRTFLFCSTASSVHHAAITLDHPQRTPTPYGGRLTWTLPGGTKMIVHLKDKNKIRHKKRWSQCMYMYYLLGYRLLGVKDEDMFKRRGPKDKREFLPGSIFRYLPEEVHQRVGSTFYWKLL